MKRPKKVYYMVRDSTGQAFKLHNISQVNAYLSMGDRKITKQEYLDVQDKSQ